MRRRNVVALLAVLLIVGVSGYFATQDNGCDVIKPARLVIHAPPSPKAPELQMSSGGVAFITPTDDEIPNGGCARGYADVANKALYVKRVHNCRTASQVMHKGNLLYALLFPVALKGTRILKDPDMTRKKFGPRGVAGMRKHPVTGQYRMHKGLDSGEVAGTQILASMTGRVTERYKQLAGGNILTLESVMGPWCVTISYLHLSRYEEYFQRGTRVNRGDPVAYSGNTGTSTTGAHLHFEIRVNRATSSCTKLDEELTSAERREKQRGIITIPAGCPALDDAGMVDPFCFPWDFVVVR